MARVISDTSDVLVGRMRFLVPKTLNKTKLTPPGSDTVKFLMSFLESLDHYMDHTDEKPIIISVRVPN